MSNTCPGCLRRCLDCDASKLEAATSSASRSATRYRVDKWDSMASSGEWRLLSSPLAPSCCARLTAFPGTTTLSDTDKKKDSTKVPRSLLNTPFQWCMGYMALAHGL
ncbi:hypothetical protein PC115_g9855 [Phytophthora cactorum]|uniref:Uncharacterized protein n=1 Tax=Phytophthora cactorum TaxID=29920 RepID=A0A8T1CDL5_9STRA|nr:hypothetical protein PC117_g20123 [Phytophthora cactorum]KAG2920352.1 hypothetical protein PC115_g9855 [Phytophthora cactorum]KAG3055461.1 hypothetical protein PC121_g15765 [Phytophthora cactorum]